jgi:hypothetical protein
MATGTRTTYTDTGPIKRSIADIISFIDPNEAALLDLFGVNNAKKFDLINQPNTKYEWLEDVMPTRTGTLNEVASAAETEIDVQAGEGALLKKGDVLLIESELVLVSSIATDTLTVVRGYAGTTDAEHADDTPWKLATIARIEGDDFTTGYTTALTIPYNYTQILSEAVKVTGSAMKNTQYGIDNEMSKHIARLIGGGYGMGAKNKAGKLALMLQNTFYHGQRYIGTATVPRAMGGFEYFVTTNVTDLSSVPLLRSHVENLQQSCFDYGGDPDALICNSWVRRKLTTIYKENIETAIDTERGGHSITYIHTDLGRLRIVLDRFCPTNRLYMVEKDKIGWFPFRPFDIYDRASTGDYVVKDVLGEYGFVVANQKAHGYLKNISTSS